VIVDEAHRMKKPTGYLAKAVKKLRANTCFALTGTLIQNRMEEMWSVLDFVSASATLADSRFIVVGLVPTSNGRSSLPSPSPRVIVVMGR
jgi:SNF2 family DNA or RNA helicase